MNKLLTIAILASSFSALAEDKEQDPCLVIEAHAAAVMQSRQDGMRLKDILKIMSDGYSKKVAIEAYKQPRFNTEKHKTRSVTEFANELYLQCLQSDGVKS